MTSSKGYYELLSTRASADKTKCRALERRVYDKETARDLIFQYVAGAVMIDEKWLDSELERVRNEPEHFTIEVGRSRLTVSYFSVENTVKWIKSLNLKG